MAADPKWSRRCYFEAIRRLPGQLLRPKTIGGLALSMLPAPAVRAFNRTLNAMRDHKETVGFREDYS
jgi:hypothetical protein